MAPAPFADLDLSRRLERAEAHACAQFAEARRRSCPGSGAEWLECAGAYAVFDGVDSPITQSFGLGIFEALSSATLDRIEHFYRGHRASIFHETSPHMGVAAFHLLCERNYRPVELSNVLYRSVESPANGPSPGVTVRLIAAHEVPLWNDLNARGVSHEHPELLAFIKQMGAISAARADSHCFLAELDGKPSAAAALCLHEGVALFAGAATVPEARRRGLQTALLQARMRYAAERGCDIAMVVNEPGSNAQRNSERAGFRVAYTRTKWHCSING